MTVRILLIIFIVLITVPKVCFAQLTGIGYGKTEDEAKQEALADLSATVKVQVYSKTQRQTSVKNGNDYSFESSRFTRLISNIPFINPNITYSKEKGSIKAVAVIDNPNDYKEKAKELSEKINSYTNFSKNSSKTIIYNRLKESVPLYEEYENYEAILKILDVDDYAKPHISSHKAKTILLDMQSTPPNLEIAAEVLTKNIKNKNNVYVLTPMYAGSDEVTDFGIFFRDIISGKLKSVQDKNAATYFMDCAYANSNRDIIMSCSLVSGGGMTVASSMVKIPENLLTGINSTPHDKNLSSLIKSYDTDNEQIKVSAKISTENSSSMLKQKETFTLLVKANKPIYLYIAEYTETAHINTAKIILVGNDKKFIMPIKSEQTNKWISLGRFNAPSSKGTSTLQIFAMEYMPNKEDILPSYFIKDFNTAEISPKQAAEDLINLFSGLEGDKSVSSITYTIIGK